MTPSTTSRSPRLRNSMRLRTIAVSTLAVLILAYLIAITIAWADQLFVGQRLAIFAILWTLGILALLLLIRAYRHFIQGRRDAA